MCLTNDSEIDDWNSGGRVPEIDPALVLCLVFALDIVKDQPAWIVVTAEKGPTVEDCAVRPVSGLVVRFAPDVVPSRGDLSIFHILNSILLLNTHV